MNNELIQKAAEALDIALGRTGVFNPTELDFMSAAYDGLVAALQPSLPHEPQVPIVWARQKDINATMIATVGERAEVAPDREPGFTVPLYLHPSTAQTSLPQDVEEWIAENEFRDSWGVNAIYTSDLRAFLAGKALVGVAEQNNLIGFARDIMECWPEGDVDGGSLQEIAERHKLIVPEIRHEPCHEECYCAEYAASDEWKDGVVCYRRSPMLTASKGE